MMRKRVACWSGWAGYPTSELTNLIGHEGHLEERFRFVEIRTCLPVAVPENAVCAGGELRRELVKMNKAVQPYRSTSSVSDVVVITGLHLAGPSSVGARYSVVVFECVVVTVQQGGAAKQRERKGRRRKKSKKREEGSIGRAQQTEPTGYTSPSDKKGG